MTTVPTPEPKGYAVTATELRRIADAIERLPGAPSHVSIDFQTAKGTDEEIAAGVDAVAMAVFGRPGKDRELSGGGSQRHVGEWTHQGGQSINVSIYQMYVRPDPKDAEIERLRSELAEARAATETAKSFLGTEGAVAEPKPDTLVVAQGRASVPDMPTHSFVRGGDDGCQWPGCTVNWAHHPLADIVIVPKVPDMQTRPQCSPECVEFYTSDRPGPQRHLYDCPMHAAKQSGGE